MSDARLIPAALLNHARAMRHEPSAAEKILWNALRDRQLGGYKFRRQKPAPPFVVDFFCAQLGLVIEVDGDSHGESAVYDARRTVRLQRDGYRVIRFTNWDVLQHRDEVLEEILRECEQLDVRKSPSP